MAVLVACLSLLAAAGSAQAAAPGAADRTFGSGGVVKTDVGTQFFGVGVQPDGQVVAAGQSGGRVLVQRFTSTGAAEATFLGPSGYARSVALQGDGKIVVVGVIGDAMFAQRLTSALTPDSSFNGGQPATTLGGNAAVGYAVGVGPDGSVTVAGSVYYPTTRVGVAHFDGSGHTQWSRIYDYGTNSLVHGLVVQPADGKIVLVGRQTPAQATNGLIIRLNRDGSVDYGFNGGAFAYHYPGGAYTELTSVALQPNGQIIAAGIGFANDANALFLRLNANGTYDKTFGSGGVTALPSTINVRTQGDPVGAYGVGIGGGGRIIGAGNFENTGADVDASLWALTSLGAPESAFGGGPVSRGPTGNYEDCAMAIAPDGSIVTVGTTVTTLPDISPCTVGTSSAGFVARYVGFGPPPPGIPVPPPPPPPPPPPVKPAAPSVTTGGATRISQVSATVTGAVSANGLSTSYHVDYGPTSAYGSRTTEFSLMAGSSAAKLAVFLKRLRPATRYHYRLVASSTAGTTHGADASFITLPALIIRLGTVGKTFRLSTLLTRGLPLKLTCNQGCTVRASLSITAADARRLRMGSRALSISTGSSSRSGRGSFSLVLRVNKRIRTAIAHQGRLQTTVQLTIAPVGGGRSVKLRKPLTLTG